MKKIIIFSLFFIFIFLLTSCNISDFIDLPTDTRHKITISSEIKNGKIETSHVKAHKGTMIEVFDTPDEYFELEYYTVNGKQQDYRQFEMPNEDVLIDAYFKELIYNIKISVDEKYCEISVDKEKAHEKDIINIIVSEKEEYELAYIYINGEKIEGLSFEMPNEDVLITASFDNNETKECEHEFNVNLIKDATCQHEGVKEYNCIYCDYIYYETTELVSCEYIDGYCKYCGQEDYYNYLYSLFGSNITTYTNDDENPYNIDLDEYGSDIIAYFYEPKLNSISDPYKSVNKDAFYDNYKPATSYEDAYYRTQHKLMSGDIKEQKYLPKEETVYDEESGKGVRISTAMYILDTNGNYLAFIPNVVDGEKYIIFYGAAYISLNEVAAYMLAFGESPVNQISNKYANGISEALSNWGIYGRVNDSKFSGDTSKYPYEPLLPNIQGNNSIRYNEADFGTTGGYINQNPKTGTYYKQTVYNNGSSISRGAARFVYVSDYNVRSIDERYVFYTYNHYNDFQEYLNYHNGWGVRFGNESAGNLYCGNAKDYEKTATSEPTSYPEVIFQNIFQIK